MADMSIITGKIEVDAASIIKAIQALKQTEEGAKGVEEAFKDLGTTSDAFIKELEKGLKTSQGGFKSLRQQIKEAKDEATALSAKFGENSQQALNATKRVAQLTEELDDFNQRVKALNPEAKFNAVSNALQGTLGALQGVTGALQLFGAESEDVTKIAQKLQGALNLAQGINSVMGLKDAFANLRIVLGLTTVATEGATAATVGFGAALSATGIGAIVLALGGLIAAYVALEKQADEAAASLKRLEDAQKNRADSEILFAKTFNKLLADRLDLLDFEIEKAQARQATEQEILALQIKRVETEIAALNAATKTGKAAADEQEKFTKRTREAIQELEILRIKLAQFRKPGEDQALIQPLPPPKEVQMQAQEALDVIGKEFKDVDWNLPPFFTEEELKRQAEIVRGFLDIASGLFVDLYGAEIQAAYEADVASLEKSQEKKLITEEQYQAGLRKIKRRQAEEQKKLAIFQATLDFSNALVNALTFKPATGVPAALILATAVAGANLARAIATPIPKFRKGQMPSLSTPFSTEDNTFAMVGKSEAIIPAEQTKAFYPTLDAIYRGHISPAKLNEFVRGSKKESPGISIDTGGVIRAIKKNKGVQIENAHTIAKLIAKEISAGYDPRKRI